MKKVFLVAALSLCTMAVSAETPQSDAPVKFGVGGNIGTTGIGFDATLGISRVFQLRGGFSFLPKREFDYNAEVYNDASVTINAWNTSNPSGALPEIPEKMPFVIQPNMTTGHVLLDIYPRKVFHLTLGVYIGKECVISAWNTDNSTTKPIYEANQYIASINNTLPEYAAIHGIGVNLGDYLLTPDADGNIKSEIHVNKLRPYFGIGFGRTVPREKKVACTLDLGLQYWGKPTFYNNTREIASTELGSKASVKLATTLPVYPVVTFRICGRLF